MILTAFRVDIRISLRIQWKRTNEVSVIEKYTQQAERYFAVTNQTYELLTKGRKEIDEKFDYLEYNVEGAFMEWSAM